MRKLKILLFFFSFCILIQGIFLAEGHGQSIDEILEDASPASSQSAESEQSMNTDKNGSKQEAAQSQKSPDKPKAQKQAYSLQLGTYLNHKKADQQIIDLKAQGYEPYIFQSMNSKNQNIYAVRIGQFNSYEEAQLKRKQIKDELNQPVLVTLYDSLEPAKTSQIVTASADAAEAETQLSSTTPGKSQVDEKASQTATPSENDQSIQEKLNTLQSEIEKLKEEAEARKKLRITKEEAREEEEDILEAAGREYTLTGAGNIKFSYSFSYSYSEFDAIKEATRVEDVANHTISNSLSLSYGLKDNITLSTGIPFKYKYHRVGTVDSKDVTDLGDLSVNWKYQPIKSGRDLPTLIVNGGVNVPVGRSPYEIDPGEELSTSSGIYSTSLGVSVSQTSDPVVVFGSMSASWPF